MTIQYGNFLSGTNCTISPSGDTDTFRFVAAVGEKIIVQVTDRYGQAGGPAACVTLFGPNGQPTSKGAKICNDVATRIDEIIATAGVHTILVQEGGFNTLSYALAIERVAPPGPPSISLCFGCSVVDAIDDAGDLDTYSFNTVAGDVVTVQVTDRYGQAGGPAACVTLFGPNGEPTSNGARVCNDVTASITQTIATAGVHTILVQEAGFRGLSYSVSLQCLAGMCSSLGLSITTSSVPTLQVGQPSSFKFDALGQPPYNWSLASGTLPPGMTLRSDGTVGGTPTQAGQFTFLIRVQDSSGITATKTFTFVVAMPTPGQVLPTGLVSRWLADGMQMTPRI